MKRETSLAGIVLLILSGAVFVSFAHLTNVSRAQVNSGIVSETPHPYYNDRGPQPFIPAQNPFYPSGYNDPPSCRNQSPHRLAHESDRSTEIKLTVSQQRNTIDGTKMVDGKNAIGGELGNSSKQESAYIVFSLPKRMAITRIGITWYDAKGFSGAPSVNPNFGSGYLLGTGFGKIPAITEETEPTCHIGELFKVSADSLMHEYELGPYPVKADYIVLKKSALAIPAKIKIGEIKVWGVEAEATTPTANETNLVGKVTVRGASKFTIPDVKIYDVTKGAKNKQLLATTDGNGTFTSVNLTPSGKPIKFLVERDGFRPFSFSQKIQVGANNKNISLIIAPPNLVKGVVRDRYLRPVADARVVARKDDKIIGIAVSNKSGNYRMELPESGSYSITATIAPTVEATKSSSVTKAVKLDKDRGEEKTLDPKIPEVQAKATTIKVELVLVDSITQYEIKGGTVRIFKLGEPNTQPIWEGPARVKTALAKDRYKVVIDIPKYEPLQAELDLRNENKDTFIWGYSLKQKITCVSASQKTVKNFDICGQNPEALKVNPEYQKKFARIDTEIDRLRKKYSVPDMPLDIRIIESSKIQAYFWGIGDGLNCPPKKENEGIDEISINTGIMNALSIEQLSHVIVHEWGHGKDWREAKCKSDHSEEDDYEMARSLLELYTEELSRFNTKTGTFDLPKQETKQFVKARKSSGVFQSFYSLITDDTFSGDFGGHPWDNSSETYASLFHAADAHYEELVKRFAEIPEEKKFKDVAIRMDHIRDLFYYLLDETYLQ